MQNTVVISRIGCETWLGRLVAEANRVIEIELVFDAKIAEALTMLSN